MNLMTEIAAKEEIFRAWMLFRNCLRIRILKLTNREGDYWSNMDTRGNKGNAFLFAIPASGYGDRCCKHCDMRASLTFFTLLEEKMKMRVIRKF